MKNKFDTKTVTGKACINIILMCITLKEIYKYTEDQFIELYVVHVNIKKPNIKIGDVDIVLHIIKNLPE